MLHWPWCSIYESIQDAGLNVILVWDEIQGEICLSIEVDKQFFLFNGIRLPFKYLYAVQREEDAVGGLVEGAVWEICRVVLS